MLVLLKGSPIARSVAAVCVLAIAALACSAQEAQTYPVKGTVFGKAKNKTGVLASSQPVAFSEAINSAAGGALTFGGHAAQVTGEASISLAGGGEFKAE